MTYLTKKTDLRVGFAIDSPDARPINLRTCGQN